MKKGIAILLAVFIVAGMAGILAACSGDGAQSGDDGSPSGSTNSNTTGDDGATDSTAVVDRVAEAREVEALITAYRDALAANDVDAVLAVYAPDGIVMGSGSPTGVGQAGLAAAYESIFEAVGLDLQFAIDEIVLGDSYGFVRSTSTGTALIRALDEEVPEENRELFVVRKVDGKWKLSHYIYNQTDPIIPATNTSIAYGTSVEAAASDRADIESLIGAYRDALAANDVDAVVALFATDGVVMGQDAATAVGSGQIATAYRGIFEAVELNIEFSIDEVIIDGEFGFVRSTSDGTALVHALGEEVPERNRELFVVQKVDGEWKLARYLYNKTE